MYDDKYNDDIGDSVAPLTAIVVCMNCGLGFSAPDFERLVLVDEVMFELGSPDRLEYRDCHCGQSLEIETTAGGDHINYKQAREIF